MSLHHQENKKGRASMKKSIDSLINQPHFTAEEREKARIVMDFYVYLFDADKADIDKAVALMGPTYTQHNPMIEDGIEGLRSWAPDRAKEGTRFDFHQLIVAGNLVIVHLHLFRVQNTSGRGEAGIDIFRFENGKIVEHWDVIQEVPERARNSNTMF
jgi:predicted SnoaL-like aldol condensation-catalyzing enzyme